MKKQITITHDEIRASISLYVQKRIGSEIPLDSITIEKLEPHPMANYTCLPTYSATVQLEEI
jgi:hypothetical protein